jgi:predicted metal-binding membrane protein
MMLAMMLPSVAPVLWRYRQREARSGAAHAALICASAGAGYLSVWVTLGIALYPLGALVTRWLARTPAAARAVPLVVSAVLLMAGAVQFTRWKAARLTACGDAPSTTCASPLAPRAGWRHGVRLGVDCCTSCANWMAILLVMGVMAPEVMVAITAAVTAERLAPGRVGVRRVTGSAAMAVGVILAIRELFAFRG